MINMSELELYNKFAEAAMLEKKHDPWRQRRKDNMTIGYFEIILESKYNWWYDDFVGVRFLGLIHWDSWYFDNYGVKKIKEVQAVAMIKNVYMNIGRVLSPEHLTLM